jgi:hypothetical protein
MDKPTIIGIDSSSPILWVNAGPSGYRIARGSKSYRNFTFLPEPALIDPKHDGLQPSDFSINSGQVQLPGTPLNLTILSSH